MRTGRNTRRRASKAEERRDSNAKEKEGTKMARFMG
jgi:hypothetical protein